MLLFVRDQGNRVQMKQKNDKLTLRIERVRTIENAIGLLEPLAIP
jgi:hypothetical protein